MRAGAAGPPVASGSGSTAWGGARPAWPGCCGSSSSPPRRCCSSPDHRRSDGAVLDQLASSSSPAYADALATYGRTLQQRNSLLRAIREDGASRDELRFWDGAFLDAGATIVAERRRLLEILADPLAAAHAEIAPEEAAAARLTLRYETNAPPLPGELPRDALARRLAETAEKEVWNGSTLDRAAPRRPRLRARWPRPRVLRLAWPAADRDPGPQAGRARRHHGTRRAPAAAPARRRLLRARPGPPLAPGPAHRRVAPGVRDDHDARRPRPRAAGDRDGLGGPHRTRRGPAWWPRRRGSPDERPAPPADGPASAT